jgi:hypothetical protein
MAEHFALKKVLGNSNRDLGAGTRAAVEGSPSVRQSAAH